MSGIAAVLRTDGGAPDAGEGARRAAALARRGAVEVRRAGPLLLAGTSLAEARGRILAFDGRLDGRDALRAALGGDAPPEGAADADLALAALLRWGAAAGAARLEGEWSFVLGDPRAGTLECGRDVVGTRPLFAGTLPGMHVAATDAAALLDGAPAAPPADEEVLAAILAGRAPAPERTILRGVERVLPGTIRSCGARGSAARRFGELGGGAAGAGAAAGAAAPAAALERFRAALEDALRRRLRGAGEARLLLGGGLDSGTIAALAAGLAREPGIPTPGTITVACPGLPCDESAPAAALAAHLGLPHLRVDAAPVGLADLRRSARESRLRADGIPALAFAGALDAVRAAGAAVLLDGEGGDEICGASPLRVADLLAAGRARAAWRAARSWSGDGGGAARVLRDEGLRPLLPDALLRLAGRLRGRPGPPPWIGRGWAAGRDVAARTRVPPPAPLRGSRAAADRREILRAPAALEALEILDRRALRAGAAAFHPFLDRRVLEAGLALPPALVDDGPDGKPALRRILADRIPPALLATRGKADFGPLVDAFLDGPDGLPAPEECALVRRGWVDRAALARLLAEPAPRSGPARATLAALADLEAWASAAAGG